MNIRKSIPLALFCLYFGKMMFSPITYIDTSMIFILGVVAGFFEYKTQDENIKKLVEDLNQTKQSFKSHIDDIENLRTSINAMKVSSGMRPMMNNNR